MVLVRVRTKYDDNVPWRRFFYLLDPYDAVPDRHGGASWDTLDDTKVVRAAHEHAFGKTRGLIDNLPRLVRARPSGALESLGTAIKDRLAHGRLYRFCTESLVFDAFCDFSDFCRISGKLRRIPGKNSSRSWFESTRQTNQGLRTILFADVPQVINKLVDRSAKFLMRVPSSRS